MSISEIERFNNETRASEDQTRDVIRSADSLEHVVKLANEKGYSFTLAEVQEYVRSKAAEKLSESNLAEVAAAGGHTTAHHATKKASSKARPAGSTVTSTVTAVTTAAAVDTVAVQSVAAATTVAAAAEVVAVVVLT